MTSKSLIKITQHLTRNAFTTEDIPAVKCISLYPDEEALCDAAYYLNTQSIEVFHLLREPYEVMWSLLHELAHHIRVFHAGPSAGFSHNADFFMTLHLLLTQAVQFGYLTKEQLELGVNQLKYRELIRNCGKVMAGRDPQKMNAVNAKKWIFVKAGRHAETIEMLRKTGYEYSESDRAWQKLISSENILNERTFLSSFKSIEKVIECPLTDLYYDPLFSVIVSSEDNDTYPYREGLKQAQFRYNKADRMWFRDKVPRSELDTVRNELHDINAGFTYNITGITRQLQEGVTYDV